MSDLFAKCELIIESIPPPPPPDQKSSRDRSKTVSSIASFASEISASSFRSLPPSNEFQELQKTWGKPIKLSAKENPLQMAVYKTPGKDGRGAWFARRSVHEGLGFSQWKNALVREFPESLDSPGQPWDGNIRGIGGEKRIEERDLKDQGHLDVYQLSAQFPGPTTPRDFITLLITSSNAIRKSDSKVPRHYMIISKPCKHEKCPPRDGYIRGQYESVEFIREVPRRASSQVSLGSGEEDSATTPADDDDESLPVEWIMLTRSDPGGSVPRFMVERGTPASICGDAVKFLDWATQMARSEDEPTQPELSRQSSLQTWETNGYLSGVNGGSGPIHSRKEEPAKVEEEPTEQSPSNSGLLAAVNQSLEMYAPQAVLNYLPGHASQVQDSIALPVEDKGEDLENGANAPISVDGGDDDDAQSTLSSSLSFASADSHFSGEDAAGTVSGTLPHHGKELRKLQERREALDAKIEAARKKTSEEAATNTEKEVETAKKAEEKHERELRKQEEKYKKEVAKLEARREKETKKIEERKKKSEEKNLSKQNEAMKRNLT